MMPVLLLDLALDAWAVGPVPAEEREARLRLECLETRRHGPGPSAGAPDPGHPLDLAGGGAVCVSARSAGPGGAVAGREVAVTILFEFEGGWQQGAEVRSVLTSSSQPVTIPVDPDWLLVAAEQAATEGAARPTGRARFDVRVDDPSGLRPPALSWLVAVGGPGVRHPLWTAQGSGRAPHEALPGGGADLRATTSVDADVALPDDDRRAQIRVARGWVLVGTGLGLAAAGGGLLLWAREEESRAERAGSHEDFSMYYRDAQALRFAGWSALGVGAGVAVAGTGVLVTGMVSDNHVGLSFTVPM